MAQATPPGPVVGPGWDPYEPNNVADKASFTVAWVQGIDAGHPRAFIDCFQFTNPPPAYLPYIWSPEFVTFETLYSHRLSPSYTLLDLIHDDEKVRHQFRDYVVAGRLDMTMGEDDAQAIAKHLEAIAGR